MPLDTSMEAVDAGDFTLAHSATSIPPLSQGFDVFRVKDGAPIAEAWTLVLPWRDDADWGEASIRYRDRTLTKAIDGKQLVIPWAEIIADTVWDTDHEAPVQIRVSIRYQGATGPYFIDLLGFAFPVVLAKGYDPLPLSSALDVSPTVCRVQYSSAGRSAIECK